MKILDKFLSSVIAVLVALMVLGCCWQVITRFILNDPSSWTEEFLRYALIWLTMLGAPYAYGQGSHLAINVLTARFSPKGKVIDKIFIEIVIMILCVTVFIIGGIMVTANSAGQISASLQLPMQIYYICIPISGVLTLFYCINNIVNDIKEFKELKEGK